MARLRPLLAPIVMLLISTWLIYDHWINPSPLVRYPKAEAAGPLFFVLGILYLGWVLYGLIRPMKVEVGMEASFLNGNDHVWGAIVSMDGQKCVLRSAEGDYTVSRYELVHAAYPKAPPGPAR